MGNSYHCYLCGRDLIAPTRNEVLKKVQFHDLQKHEVKEHSRTELHEIRKRIEGYMEKGFMEN